MDNPRSSSNSKKRRVDFEEEESEDELTKLRRELSDLKEFVISDELTKLRRQLAEQKEFLLSVFTQELYFVLPSESKNRDLLKRAVCGGHVEWDELPVEWKNDLDAVVTALESDRMKWKDVPEQLKRKPIVIVAAFQRELLSWKDVPDELKNDPSVAFEAWERQFVEASDVPCLDRDFFRDALEHEKVYWDDLPAELKCDLDLARSVCHFSSCVCSVLHYFPVLSEEREMWMNIIDSPVDDLVGVVEKFAPGHVHADRELMLKACQKEHDMLRYVDPILGTDHSFLEALLEDKPLALEHMSHEAQILFPDLLLRTLQSVAESPDLYDLLDPSELAESMAPELWTNRRFVETWFRSGLPFVELSPESLKSDKEIYLLIATHCCEERRFQSFATASPSLRDDKDFMLQVLERDASLFGCASFGLQQDFDLAVLAFSTSRALVESYARQNHYNGQHQFFEHLRAKVREKLKMGDTFFATILCGMSQEIDSECSLTLLNQGTETVMSYKKLIAQFLDVPIGSEVRLLRRSAENLSY